MKKKVAEREPTDIRTLKKILIEELKKITIDLIN
jgi:hypothetical protein